MTMPYQFGSTAESTLSVKGKVGAQKSAAVVRPTLTGVTAGAKKVTTTWKKATGATKYQVRYSTAKSMKGAKIVNIAKSKTSHTITGLASGKRYYVQVRTFRSFGGHAYYSAWSNQKSAVAK